MAQPWLKYQQAPQAPVIAPPDPYKQAQEQRAQQDQGNEAVRLQMEQERLRLAQDEAARGAAKDALAQQEAQDKLQKVENARRTAIGNLANVINKIDEVALDSADNGGWFETGFIGSMARNIPGTPGFDLAGNVKTIDANAAFNALAEMRNNSPTGGALGQVTERELDLLKSSVANLDTAQSQQQFFDNLASAKRIYLDMLGRLDPEAVAQYQDKAGIRFNDDGSAVLVFQEGEDKREPTDPMGIMGGGSPPDNDGGGPSLRSIGTGLAMGVSDIVKGGAALPGMVINPIGQALYDVLGYDQRYDTGQILSSGLGLPDNTSAAASAINQGATAALTGGLGARAASAITNPGVAQNALNVIGRTPIRDTAAGAGAGAGMVAGERSGIPGGALAGALAGGLAGYGGANALAGVAGNRGANALLQAAERQNVDLLPADAGGAAAKAVTTGTKASPLSVAPVVKAAQRQQGQVRDATRRAAESQGEIVSTEQAGQGVRAAAERFTKQTSQRASRLYDRANEAARGVRIKPNQTIAKLDEHIARLRNDPSAPESAVAELTRFRDNIAGGVSVSGLRDARSRLSQGVFDGKLRSGSEQAMWKDILGNLSSDIDLGLQNAGRNEAAAMFKRADAFWQQRVEHIDKVLQPILGRDKSGEQIVSAVESMARGQSGGNARLSRLLAEMTPEESGQVRAVIVDRLGRATPGAQDAEGAAFSASTFLTNWNKMTPQAKGSLFADKGLRDNLNDIATLAEGMKASQSMANFSNTAVGVGSNVGAGVAIGLANPALVLIGGGAQALTGRLMASPAFARLLARTAKMPPQAANRTLKEQLGILAGREPIIANDIQSVQRFLSEAAGRSPGRAAAEDEND